LQELIELTIEKLNWSELWETSRWCQ